VATAVLIGAVASLPAASAEGPEPCVVTVTVLGGVKLSFTLNVVPGTPLSDLSLPVKLPILGISEACSGTATTPSTPTTTTPTTSAPTSAPPRTSGRSTPERPSVRTSRRPAADRSARSGEQSAAGAQSNAAGATAPSTSAQTRASAAPPSPANPSYSLALPGPASIGVPNFFIDSFQIPPFLLPIYEAAGIQYDVPWQALAAINQIETDYGRNLSVSSAGAVGWMQFLPSTWKRWAVDATGAGYADPYNPVDAIFTAARYLQAAGAATNLPRAIFAYNHANWYVQSVLLRAKLIGGTPTGVIGALTGLVQGRFPVAATATYADDKDGQTSIFAHPEAPVIAVNDGRIVGVGDSPALGRYIELRDSTGNVYTYAGLGSIPRQYPVPKPIAVPAAAPPGQLADAPAATPPGQLADAPVASSSGESATAGRQSIPGSGGSAAPTAAAPASAPGGIVKERLFADPRRPASYAAGGRLQLGSQSGISSFQNYFSDVLHLARDQYTLKPLEPGAIVIAGTIIGRIGQRAGSGAPHMAFMIRPTGANSPRIDPKPILDGWKLLEATAPYRVTGIDPFYGPGAKSASTGQVLLMSQQQLEARILADPHVRIYACGRRDIRSGLVDRRILAALEFLSASGLDPSVSGLVCGAPHNGTDAVDRTGESVDVTSINGIPMRGHQAAGSITDVTIRRLLTLQGAMAPDEIVSLRSYAGQANTLALPDHADRIQISYAPVRGAAKRLAQQVKQILRPAQWIQLIDRIGKLPEPVVPTAPTRYALRSPAGAAGR
jgi:membrane-bound lytic murein transglycosylase B